MKCQTCKGSTSVWMKCFNHGTRSYEHHIVNCPMCDGKGYVTEEDRNKVKSVEQFYQITHPY